MKILTALSGFAVLFLLGCQLPLTVPGSSTVPAVSSAPGKASLAVSIRTNGFTFVPTKAASAGRFVIPPSPTPGVAYYLLHDPTSTLPDVTGDSTTPPTDITPGNWNLTVTLKDVDGIRVLGTGYSPVTLLSGPNPVTINVTPTRVGNGRLDVSYSWVTSGVDSATVLLDQLTLTDQGSGVYTVTPTPVTPAAPVIDLSGHTVHFVMDVPSGSYRLTLKLQTAGFYHPPVTGTAEVYDGVTSLAVVSLSATDLNGPPDPPLSVGVGILYGHPYITWSSAASTATGFELYRNGSLIQTLGAMAGGYEDTGYPPGSILVYDVKAINSFGSSITLTAPAFEGATGMNITPSGVTRLGVGDNLAIAANVVPMSATVQGILWSSDQSFSSASSNTAQVRGMRLGLGTVTATSQEALAYSDTATLQVEAKVSTFAGQVGSTTVTDGTGLGANFWEPSCMTMGPDGNLYLVDMFNHIRRITPDGVVTTLDATTFYTYATGIAVDAALNVYVADGHAIYKAPFPTYTGAVLAGIVGSLGYLDGPGVSALFHTPRGLAVDTAGTFLYVADGLNNVIRKVDTTTGLVTTYAGNQALGSASVDAINPLTAQFAFPSGLAFDKDGNLYVVDFSGYQRVRRIAAAAGPVTTVAGLLGGSDIDGDASAANFAAPYGIAVDGQDLYVAEWVDTVRRIRLPGPGQPLAQVTTLAGSQSVTGITDGLGGDARFGGAKGLTGIAASHGNVFVIDTGNSTIRKIVTTPYDAIAYTDGEFSDPSVMSYNSGTFLYAGDGSTGKIRVGTVVLFNTGLNHGKALVTGIDDDYQGNPGYWRMHLDWMTWDGVGNVVSTGKDLTVVNAGGGIYIDFDSGTIVGTSINGDVYLAGSDSLSRVFNAANGSTTLGLYK